MTLRTVLLYLDHPSNAERLTRLAARLATRADGTASACLHGAHATSLLPIYGGVTDAVTGGAALRYAEAQHALTDRIRTRFLDDARAAGVEASWEGLADDALGEGAALREKARAADLVVLPQPEAGAGSRFLELAVRDVLTGAGRPVLVVPRAGNFDDVGARLLIGWSPTPEATRAVHGSLALVRPGCRATLLWIARGRGTHPELERSARAMAGALERHGVTVDVTHRVHTELPVGDVLLNEAFERGADLIVSGAYGHSRLYDAVVGATTSHLLEHMTVPVLFAH